MRRTRLVAIRRLPERMDRARRRAFYGSLEECINVDRPSLVLDCSMLNMLDSAAMQALLCCLEEAIKRNGDVRLAALGPEAKAIMQSTGLDALFEMFETVEQAVQSFQNPRISVSLQRVISSDEHLEVNAA